MPIDFSKFQKKEVPEEEKIAPEETKSLTPDNKKNTENTISKKKKKITGDKKLSKEETIEKIITLLKTSKKSYTLDWLRGELLTFQAIHEVRKE